MSRPARRALSAALGLVADRVMGEPPASVHPVARFGQAMTALETRLWGDRVAPGAAYATAGIAGAALLGRLVPSVAGTTATVVAGRELRRVAGGITDALERDDLEAARALLPSLVGRDPSRLDRSEIAAAVVESVAENTVDAVVAPVFWAVVAGAPGALAYRAVNTMDAMVGHRSDRYERFGKVSARLDDAANWVPARLTALLFAAAAPDRAGRVWSAVRRDASRHPSPNAGVAEAAAAGALGVQVGGPLWYGDRFEQRPHLGDGPRPEPADARAMVQLARRAETLLIVALVAAAVVGWKR